MIVEAGGTRFRGADVYVTFRELWRAAKGTDTYSDERLDFIFNSMRALATAAAGADEPETGDAVAALMRRVETERMNTPAHLLALGGLLGRYGLSDESARDLRLLDRAREELRQAWWSSGLDRDLLGRD